MVRYVQTSRNYFQKQYKNGKKVRVSREVYERNSQSGGAKRIHNNAQEQGLQMTPRAMIMASRKLEVNGLKRCAKHLESELGLSKIGTNNLRSPIWIEKPGIKSNIYVVFVASDNKILSEDILNILNVTKCLSGTMLIDMSDMIIPNKKITYLDYIKKLTSNENATTSYRERLALLLQVYGRRI